ncbi:MAG: UbiH/UbiF/VisC/COQ6 family ubiquinone biosynthesis hydroxylase [Alphaproteobacteria bacterium]
MVRHHATRHHDTEVAIVGGGMVGLALAIALAEHGFEVTVIDAKPAPARRDPAFDGRASAIAAATARMLDRLGLWQAGLRHALAPVAEPILEIRVSDGDAPLHLHYDHAEVGAGPLGYMIENRDIIAALHERAAALPITLIAPATVTGFEARPGATRLAFKSRSCAAPLVVGADGRESPLRALAGIGASSRPYGQTGIVCTVRHERPHRGIAHERFLPAGPFAILPLKGDRSSLVWTERSELAPTLVALPDDDFLDELAWRFGDFLGRLALEGPRWSYPLALVRAERIVGPRLALVGDAAHAIHPIAGQGFNLGLRDVATLAHVLADGRAVGLDPGDAAMLGRYARWRGTDAFVLATVTDGLNRLFSNDLAPVRLVRDLGLAAVDRLPPLKRLFMRHAMGTLGRLPRLLDAPGA